MKKIIYYSLVILIFFSCKEKYIPEIETDLKIMTVDGLITDSVGLNFVKLHTASPFNIHDTLIYGTTQFGATVYLTDNSNKSYNFFEEKPGYYIPVDSSFKGIPGNTYILNVIDRDGNIYISSPQKLLPNIQPDSVYLKKDIKDDIYTDGFGYNHLVVKDINKICLNYKGDENEFLRFRYNTEEYIEYLIIKPVPMEMHSFFCWYTIVNDDGLIFTDEKYPTSSTIITGFPMEWFYKLSYLKVRDMNPFTDDYDTTVIKMYPFTRVIRINQFRINNDTYQYNKDIANQTADAGKIFDPITAQLYGNMKCLNETNKLVLGFFETSSVKTITYAISSYHLDKIKQVPNVLPPPKAKGFILVINDLEFKPEFWITYQSLD